MRGHFVFRYIDLSEIDFTPEEGLDYQDFSSDEKFDVQVAPFKLKLKEGQEIIENKFYEKYMNLMH